MQWVNGYSTDGGGARGGGWGAPKPAYFYAFDGRELLQNRLKLSVKGSKLFLHKHTIMDVWQGSKHATEK